MSIAEAWFAFVACVSADSCECSPRPPSSKAARRLPWPTRTRAKSRRSQSSVRQHRPMPSAPAFNGASSTVWNRPPFHATATPTAQATTHATATAAASTLRENGRFDEGAVPLIPGTAASWTSPASFCPLRLQRARRTRPRAREVPRMRFPRAHPYCVLPCSFLRENRNAPGSKSQARPCSQTGSATMLPRLRNLPSNFDAYQRRRVNSQAKAPYAVASSVRRIIFAIMARSRRLAGRARCRPAARCP